MGKAEYGTIYTEFCKGEFTFTISTVLQKETWNSQVGFFCYWNYSACHKNGLGFIFDCLFGFVFFFQWMYTSRLMESSITRQQKSMKQNFCQNSEVMLANSWCTTFTPLKQEGATPATAGRVVAKGPEKWKENIGLFCHVLIPFKRY